VRAEEFLRLLEEATEVRSDLTGRYYLVRSPGDTWRLFRQEGEGAFLLFAGEEALRRAPEFRVPVPEGHA